MSLFDLIYHASSIFIFILGVFVLADNLKQKTSWIFSIWAFSASAWMQTLYWGFWLSTVSNWSLTLLTFRFAFATSVLMLSLITVFFYYFPRVNIKVPFVIRFLYVGFTVALVAASLTALIHKGLVIEEGVYIADELGKAYPLYTFDILLNFFAALYLAIRKILKESGIERKKLFLSTFGYFIFVFFAIIFNVVLPFFGIIILSMQSVVPILTLVFVIPAFIALQRYRFFNLSYVSLNATRKIIFYTLSLITIWLIFGFLNQVWPVINLMLAGGISVTFGIFLIEKLDEIIPQFSTNDLRNIRNAISELKTVIFARADLGSLQDAIQNTFQVKLNYVSAKLYVVRQETGNFKFSVYPKDKFTSALNNYKQDLLVYDEVKYSRHNESTAKLLQSTLNKLEADVCVPLFSADNLIGFITLRKKANERYYSSEELDEVSGIQRGLAITLMNILLKLNLEEENNLMKAIIDKKTKQLKKKIEEINELLMQQSDFIAVTAHEFRTPLSIATFQLDDVLSSKNNKEDLTRDLKTVESSLENLKNLTEKLFAVQQYDLNKVSLNPVKVDMADFTKKLFKDFMPIMKKKKIDFNLKMHGNQKLYAKVDQAQFRQVLSNLLNNASKFTPEKGKITLEMREARGSILIKVTDSGGGIPDKLKKSIFEKFRTKNAGAGIGLGLYLCKKIVELHKGKIWVEDAKPTGASFCVEIKQLSR